MTTVLRIMHHTSSHPSFGQCPDDGQDDIAPATAPAAAPQSAPFTVRVSPGCAVCAACLSQHSTSAKAASHAAIAHPAAQSSSLRDCVQISVLQLSSILPAAAVVGVSSLVMAALA